MKKIKMILYGEPGTGKSTFASKAPKPFFITTDGNYDWLDMPDEDHVQIFSWSEAKKVFRMDFSKYETIVLDLTEDCFKWCEAEFCITNKLTHVSDLGFGKGYDITRNEFFIEVSKLLALDKNVILIMHGLSKTEKDRRGVEFTKYVPTSRLPDKVLDMLEGRVRYCLRCFAIVEETENGKLVTNRYLSLSPDGITEYGIARGLPATAPRTITLDWDTFVAVVEPNEVKKVKKVPSPSIFEEDLKADKLNLIDDNTLNKNADVNVEDTPKSKKVEDLPKVKVIRNNKEKDTIDIDSIKEQLVAAQTKGKLDSGIISNESIKDTIKDTSTKESDTNDSTKVNQASYADKLAAIKAILEKQKAEKQN